MENSFFQPQMDESNFLEEIRNWEHSPWYDHPIRGESQRDFLVEIEGSLPPPQDSFLDAGEATNDFWSMSGIFIFRHHVEPRVKLYSPREESFPVPLKYIDVSRTTRTNLDVMQERRIDDYWNIDGWRDLSDSWTGFTQFTLLEEKPPDGNMWSGESLTRRQLTSRPDHLWPEIRGKTNDFKSKFACIFAASESTRLRVEESLPNYHEDHIAGRGEQFTATLQFGTQNYSYASSNEDTRSRSNSG